MCCTWLTAVAVLLSTITTAAAVQPGPLGMQSGDILDAQLSASTYAANHSAVESRLESNTAWCADVSDSYQWLEIAFGELVTLTEISMQGRAEAAEWTTGYRLSYKPYEYWQFYTNSNGEHEVFVGNTDQTTVVSNTLAQAVEAEVIRIHPVTYSGRMCLRVEVFGYRMGPSKPTIDALGIESGDILDEQFSASSVLTESSVTFDAFKSRLNSDHPSPSLMKGWCGTSETAWIQVDLLTPVLVTALNLQIAKRTSGDVYMYGYEVFYSNDGSTFSNAYNAANERTVSVH